MAEQAVDKQDINREREPFCSREVRLFKLKTTENLQDFRALCCEWKCNSKCQTFNERFGLLPSGF